MTQAKTPPLYIRLNSEEAEVINKAVNLSGKGKSAFCRETLLLGIANMQGALEESAKARLSVTAPRVVRRELASTVTSEHLEKLDELNRQLSAIGNNLNQVARCCNTGEEDPNFSTYVLSAIRYTAFELNALRLGYFNDSKTDTERNDQS